MDESSAISLAMLEALKLQGDAIQQILQNQQQILEILSRDRLQCQTCTRYRSRLTSRSRSHSPPRSCSSSRGSIATTVKEHSLHELGLNNVCLQCGEPNYTAWKCNASYYRLKCSKCKRTGHVSSVCISSRKRGNYKDLRSSNDQQITDSTQHKISMQSYTDSEGEKIPKQVDKTLHTYKAYKLDPTTASPPPVPVHSRSIKTTELQPRYKDTSTLLQPETKPWKSKKTVNFTLLLPGPQVVQQSQLGV